MAGINVSSLTKDSNQQPSSRRRSSPSLSKLSEAYRNPSKSDTENSSNVVDDTLIDALKSQNSESSHSTGNLLQDIGTQLVTNKGSISNQLVTRKDFISNQLVTNKESIGNQGNPAGAPISNQLVTQLVTPLVTNKESISNQLVTEISFKGLSGLQRLISSIIFNDIKYSDGKITRPMSLSYLAQASQTTTKTVKTATQRLVKKGVIKREGGKRGKGGWAQFSINKAIYNEMLHSELVTNKESIGNQLVTNWEPNRESNREPSLSSSNSSNNTNTITTRDEDWVQKIQTPLNLKNLGFGIGHIKQLKDKFALTPELIQQGLEAFSYDLEKGELERLKSRGVQNIIGYFFGAMKSGGYNPISEGFITAEELAEKEMIQRLELKQKEGRERSEKLLNLLFEEWIAIKGKEELIKIEKPVYQYLDMFHKNALKDYFQKYEIENFRKEI